MQVNLGGERVADKGLYYRSDTKHLFLRGGFVNGHCMVVDGLPYVVQSHTLDALSARLVRLSDPHTPLPPQTAYINSSKVIYPASATAQDWHLRLGHLSASALKQAVQTHNGIVIEGNIPDKLSCEACQLATAKRKISRVPGKRPTTPYDEISVDTVVPKAAGLGYGSVQYITTVTDGMCLYRHGKSHRTRGGAGVYLMDHTTYIKTQLDIDVKNIRADNDKALTDNGAFHTFCTGRSIRILSTTPHDSEQNGRAESTNNLVVLLARKMMISGKLPIHVWPEAVQAASTPVAKSFAMDGHRLVNTPLDIHFKFEKAPEGYQASKHPQNQYQQLVGSIMWPAQMTRIEAILSAHLLSKYVCNPTEGHLAQVVRTLAYLTQHPNDGICLGGSPQSLVLEGFVDSSFGDDPDSRRSTCGYIFRLGEGPVSFKSGLQPLLTQSSTKAEYIAMVLAAREAKVWAWIVNSSHLCFWEHLTQKEIGSISPSPPPKIGSISRGCPPVVA